MPLLCSAAPRPPRPAPRTRSGGGAPNAPHPKQQNKPRGAGASLPPWPPPLPLEERRGYETRRDPLHGAVGATAPRAGLRGPACGYAKGKGFGGAVRGLFSPGFGPPPPPPTLTCAQGSPFGVWVCVCVWAPLPGGRAARGAEGSARVCCVVDPRPEGSLGV